MPGTENEITGYFLSFAPDEKKALDEMLLSEGYEAGPQGIKDFLLDFLESGETVETDTPVDRVVKRVEDFLVQNPDTVKKAVDFGSALFNTVRHRRKK